MIVAVKLHKFIQKDLRHVCSTDQLSQLFGKQKKYVVNKLFLCHGVVILGCKSPRCNCLLLYLSGHRLFHGHALAVTKQLLFEITGFEIATLN